MIALINLTESQGVLLKGPPGVLFATANYADEGTFQLTPPFLDRFDVAVMVTSPQPWDLRKIRERGDEKLNGHLESLLVIPENLKLDFETIRREINAMPEKTEYSTPLVSAFADFLYASLRFSEAASDDLSRATKGNAWRVNQDRAQPGHFTDSPFTYTLNEISVRSVAAMQRYAKAFSWFLGKDEAELSDLKKVLPYLLWHKIQPSSKALAENPKYENDRIAFVNGLIEKVENDYNELLGSESFNQYSAALNAIRTGRIADASLDNDQIRNVAKNTISRLGLVDRPYAITLASHIAAEYNSRTNGRK